VMVPVPEEHVEDVMQFILRAIARASIVPWDEASLGETYHEVDETTRSLLAFVARAEAEGKELDSGTAARQIQMSPREVNGILNELQTMTRDSNRPPLVVVRVATQRLANGRTTEQRVVSMEPEVADLVRAVERAELAQAKESLDPLRERS